MISASFSTNSRLTDVGYLRAGTVMSGSRPMLSQNGAPIRMVIGHTRDSTVGFGSLMRLTGGPCTIMVGGAMMTNMVGFGCLALSGLPLG